jgi:hypothetical protein
VFQTRSKVADSMRKHISLFVCGGALVLGLSFFSRTHFSFSKTNCVPALEETRFRHVTGFLSQKAAFTVNEQSRSVHVIYDDGEVKLLTELDKKLLQDWLELKKVSESYGTCTYEMQSTPGHSGYRAIVVTREGKLLSGGLLEIVR